MVIRSEFAHKCFAYAVSQLCFIHDQSYYERYAYPDIHCLASSQDTMSFWRILILTIQSTDILPTCYIPAYTRHQTRQQCFMRCLNALNVQNPSIL